MTHLKLLISLLFLAGSGSLMASEQPAWSYEGAGSPEHWGELSPTFKLCKDGKNQSPINISSAIKTQKEPLSFRFNDVPLTEVNNGHTVQVNDNGGDLLTLDNDTYSLVQFHFHTPSENTIDGKSFPLEAHFVHKNTKGQLAVVAIMYQLGKENSELQKVWQQMPKRIGKEVHVKQRINLKSLFPEELSYYRFVGSLTTPPCTEGVNWIVLKHSSTISQAQLDTFTNTLHHHNNRPTQPLNGRVIGEQ